jgi:hypothetical protein
MGISTSEVGYTSATTGREDHEVHKGHVVGGKKPFLVCTWLEFPFEDGDDYLVSVKASRFKYC